MVIYTRDEPVNVVEDGVAVPLTAKRLAADVVEQVGGVTAITGPSGPRGPQGEQGPAGAPGAGVPAGGTTGQLLAKSSAADRDATWVDAPLSGGSATTATLRRLGTGGDEAAPGARAVGFAVSGASRPAGYAVVIWTGANPPSGQAGDIWIRTS